MKKHIWLPLSIWFSVLQCFCWNWKLPVSAETTQTLRTADGIYYEILDNQAVQITGSKDTLSELVIPDEIDGLPVTKIKDYAFVNHTRLRSVSISESVQEIRKLCVCRLQSTRNDYDSGYSAGCRLGNFLPYPLVECTDRTLCYHWQSNSDCL